MTYIKIFLVTLFVNMVANSVATGTSYARFEDGLIKYVKAEGWLNAFLERQRTGLTGHPEALSYPFNSCLWAGEILRNNEKYGSDWWRYEQTAYFTDGLLSLGYLLRDRTMIEKAVDGIRYTFAHASTTGVLGDKAIKSMWPMCVYFRVLKTYYDYTQYPEIEAALERHYLNFSIHDLENERNIVSIEGMLWCYQHSGNSELLRRAEIAYNRGNFGDLTPMSIENGKSLSMHGVTCMEELKLPMLLYACTGEHYYLDLARRAEEKLVRDNMLPDGVPVSAEYLIGNKNVINSHETCDIIDYTWTLGYFLATTGEAVWADKIERAVFNAGLGAITKDFKSLQYFSSVNQFIVTGDSNHNDYFHGSTWMAYRPTHETECCSGNINRLMPNYVSRMWMKGSNGEIVAAMYGPSQVSLPLKSGEICTITQQTKYPFDGHIEFHFDVKGIEQIPFMLRIPGWCRKASIKVNGIPCQIKCHSGKFVTIDRAFKRGDCVELDLDMLPVIQHLPMGAYIERGPLLYSFPIAFCKSVDNKIYPNMNGKVPGNPDFKCWSFMPKGPWNYALCEDAQLKVIENRHSKGYPFDIISNPIRISAAVKPIEWKLVENRYTPPLPTPEKVRTVSDHVQHIELVPYGCTELRLTVFPVVR